MMFEDKRLHEVPKPWKSMTRLIGSILLLFGLGFTLTSALLFFFLWDYSDIDWPILLIILSLGLLFLFIGLRAFMDKRDRWEICLPFNNLLFELVSDRAVDMLAQNKYKFKENEKSTIIGVIMNGGKPVAKSYRIFLAPDNYFDFEFALTMTSSDNGNNYNFIMIINWITMKNLNAVKIFQGQLQNFLKEIEYKKFKEVQKI